MNLNLEGKTAIVTGAAQGMGLATVKILSGYGCNVIMTDIQQEKLLEACAEISCENVVAKAANVSNAADVEALVSCAIERFGSIDILVNSAGIITSALITELEEDTFDKVLSVNCKGVFLTCKAVARHMIEKGIQGRIVNVASQSGRCGEASNGVYCASKAMVISLTQTLCLELGQYGITANSVCPGMTDTAMIRKVFATRAPIMGVTPEELEKTYLKNVPLGRMAQDWEIGELIAFLCSDKARFITGESILITGGQTIV